MTEDGKLIGGMFGTALSAVGAGLSVTELQAIVSMIATIIGLLITIMTGVVIPVIKKYKKAKEDGKVTVDEAIAIIETAKDGLDKAKEEIDKNQKGE